MLFLVVQTHAPEHCPQREGLGPESLFEGVSGVHVRHAVADVPGHRLVYLIEADSYDAIQDFLEPGRTRCDSVITPVMELQTG